MSNAVIGAKTRRRTFGNFLVIPVVGLCLALSTAAGLSGQTLDEAWLIERLARSEALAAHTTVEIHNPFGDLRVRAANDDQIAISALAQRHRDDPTLPTIETRSVDGRLIVRVAYADAAPANDGHARRRVDVTAFVPAGPRVDLRTVDGLLNVRLANDLALATVSGAIDVKTRGLLEINTDRGDVLAVLQASTWSGTQRLVSTSGALELWLPRDVAAAVTAETAGRLTTDYSVDVQHDDAAGRKRVTARLGAGGGGIELRSVNGPLRLMRSP